MARVRTALPHAEITRYMRTNPALSMELIAQGRKAQSFWQTLPPAIPTGRPTHGKEITGEYGDSIQIQVIRTATRMKVRVYTKDPRAHWIEYGSKHMPEYAPMAKTRAFMIGEGGRPMTHVS